MSAMLRLLGWLLALAMVTLPVVAVLNGWVGAGHWPLTRLRANGAFERVDPALLRRTLLPYAQRGFFAVDLEAAQAAVAALPWVEHAEVSKHWPDVLEVRVVEHRPFARWGNDRLLSDRGRLFAARGVRVPANLPLFDGPATRAADVVALYNDSRALFEPLGLGVRAVRVDARGSWTLALGNGTDVVVGRNEAHARMARFVRLLPQLLAQPGQRLARADLRYTNGFALVWAKLPANTNPPAPTPAPTSAPARAPLPAAVDPAAPRAALLDRSSPPSLISGIT